MVHHRRGLRRLLGDDELLARIDTGWRGAGLDGRRVAILEFAEKLTLAPGDVVADDLVPMRENGLTDRDIHDVVEVTAYYAYVNRIADGLGVELETWLPPD